MGIRHLCERLTLHTHEDFICVVTAIDNLADQYAIVPPVIFKITLALDELVANIFNYAFDGDQEPRVDVMVCIVKGYFYARVSDTGRMFDLTEIAPPEVDVPLDERARPVGGMGIHLVRQLMDSVTYYRYNDKNHVIICTKIDPETDEKGAGHGVDND